MYTSLLALGIGTAFGVAAAVFLSEGYLGGFVFSVLKIFHVEFQPFWREAARAGGKYFEEPD